ncbi:MAG TPA: hypothetical protein VMZ05_03405 [Spirochaetota bacterium]|nr:hypothetical protein [Spirochaetota bacterium]
MQYCASNRSSRPILIFLCSIAALMGPVSGFCDMYIQDEVTGIDKNGRVEEIRIERSFVVLSGEKIYHHDFLTVRIMSDLYLDPEALTMRVYRDGMVCPLLGLTADIPFLEETGKNDVYRYRAVYLPSWNEPEGEHEVRLYYGDKGVVTKQSLSFVLERRPLSPIKQGLSIVDLEMYKSIKAQTCTGPYGNRTDYRAILEWARFMGADALWVLAGETTAFTGREGSRGELSPWADGPLENLYLLKGEASEYGVEIGAYVMSFYVPGKGGVPERYEPGIGYNSENDYLYRSRFISLGCEQRILDIIELVKGFQNDPDIRYIGFDFLRTGRADGYELAPLVVRDTNIEAPPEWERLSLTQKTRWFARKVEVEKDPMIVEKWRWWRAREVAKIVERVISEAGLTKPVWVYTLGWNHGKEHGQDPVMLFDAGVAIDAVMLYESDRFQFPRMLEQWRRYIKAGQGNVVIGNCVDYRLLDSAGLSPPEEFYRRNVEGYSGIMDGGTATGVFFHDISRALWGRRGGYSFLDYAFAHGSSVYRLLQETGNLGLVVDIVVDKVTDNRDAFRNEEKRGDLEGYLVVKNNSTASMRNIIIETLYFGKSGVYLIEKEGSRSFTSSLHIEEIPGLECKRLRFHAAGVAREGLRFIVDIEGKKRYYITEPVDSIP